MMDVLPEVVTLGGGTVMVDDAPKTEVRAVNVVLVKYVVGRVTVLRLGMVTTDVSWMVLAIVVGTWR